MPTLTPEQISTYQTDGFLILPRFAASDLVDAMHAAAVEIARRSETGQSGSDGGAQKWQGSKSLVLKSPPA